MSNELILQVYDIWFRPIFAFFIVDVNTKRVVYVGVTRNLNCATPHQGIAQQVPVPSNRTSYSAGANVLAMPILGGLHNDYRAAA